MVAICPQVHYVLSGVTNFAKYMGVNWRVGFEPWSNSMTHTNIIVCLFRPL